jgi:hypothetical protein
MKLKRGPATRVKRLQAEPQGLSPEPQGPAAELQSPDGEPEPSSKNDRPPHGPPTPRKQRQLLGPEHASSFPYNAAILAQLTELGVLVFAPNEYSNDVQLAVAVLPRGLRSCHVSKILIALRELFRHTVSRKRGCLRKEQAPGGSILVEWRVRRKC